MVQKIHKQENTLDDSIYDKENVPFQRIILTALILIPLGFILNFPLKGIIRSLVLSGLSNNTACPVLYSDVEVSYFFPKIIIKNPTITKACINALEENLNLDDIIIRPHLPSLKVLGIRFSVNLKKDKTNIYMYPVIGLGKILITIDDSTIHSDTISYFTGGLDLFDGTFNLNLSTQIENQQLQTTSIKLESRDLYIKESNVSNFIIPQIPLLDFSIRATLNADMTLRVAPGQLIIGNKNSPIFTSLGGTINIRKDHFASSNIDMTGEMILTNKFLDLFPIIRLKIPNISPTGNYIFLARGPLLSPESYRFQ